MFPAPQISRARSSRSAQGVTVKSTEIIVNISGDAPWFWAQRTHDSGRVVGKPYLTGYRRIARLPGQFVTTSQVGRPGLIPPQKPDRVPLAHKHSRIQAGTSRMPVYQVYKTLWPRSVHRDVDDCSVSGPPHMTALRAPMAEGGRGCEALERRAHIECGHKK
jgi:hypothetical protein